MVIVPSTVVARDPTPRVSRKYRREYIPRGVGESRAHMKTITFSQRRNEVGLDYLMDFVRIV